MVKMACHVVVSELASSSRLIIGIMAALRLGSCTSQFVTRNLAQISSAAIRKTRNYQFWSREGRPPITVAQKQETRQGCHSQSRFRSEPLAPQGGRALHSLAISARCQHGCCFHTSVMMAAETEKVVVTPPFADSISEGDIRWEKEVGDAVAEDDVVAEIETDKTSIPITAPFAGVIAERFVDDGATVQPGAKLFKITTSGAPVASPKTEKPVAPTTPPPTPSSSSSAAGPIPSAPPSPPPPVPTAPMASRPVTAVKPTPAAARPAPPPSVTTDADAASRITGTRSEHRVKMSRMRQRIAQRLKDAQNINAMLTTFNEIDMSNVMGMRKKHQDGFTKKHGIKLGFMSAFVRASVYALLDQPVVNAVIDGQEIVYRDYVDVSVAVASPKGLVVPVIRNAERMNYADIEKAIMALGEKARIGSLAIEDMDGGTFTISNGGVFGSLYGTPIINPPQSAILGMHAIVDRPVAIDGKIEIRPMMYVALTYDHRLIDGREAVLFLRKIKAAVEDPRIMLLDI